QSFEEGLYFTDYLTFCADATRRIRQSRGAPAPEGFGKICVSNVTFTYPGSTGPALEDVTIEIGSGEVVPLVGETGSGKTTLAKIMAGLYLPQAGSVHWDRTPTADVDPQQLREHIAVIAQDHANWPLTVRHNIMMGRPSDPSLLADAVTAADAGS